MFRVNFLLLFLCELIQISTSQTSVEKNVGILKRLEETEQQSNLEQLITDILFQKIRSMKCFALLCDKLHCELFTRKMFKKFKLYVTYFLIEIDDSEDLLSPFNGTQESLLQIKTEGCKFYIILLANGLQVSRLLQFADRYRMLNTRANFIFLYDIRLFHKSLHYLWNRMVNVVFIREYGGRGNSQKTVSIPWYDLSTVPFPSPIRGVFIPHRLDIWRKGRFRLGVNLFRDKTSDLRSQVLKVVTFQHIPAVVKTNMMNENSTNFSVVYSGLEVEILQTLAEEMNFQTSIYELENANVEKWGQKQDGKFSGLLGEMVKFKAEIALGDLYYSPYHLELMDLSIPYNTECLTFLTPESSTDNSWMTLVLPFKLYMWITVFCVLLVMSIIFHYLAKFHHYLYDISHEKTCIIVESKTSSPDVNLLRKKLHSPFKYLQFHKRKLEIIEEEEKPSGLYLFEDKFNTFLYTYSMMLLIALPKVPDGWSLRVIVGWYFLYCTLVVVSYKASMTAILANPAPKITIDTLDNLEKSGIACGGWGEVKEFFLTSLDTAGQKIGEIFEYVNDTNWAVERVAKGDFAFYENIYFLKAASVKRELLMQKRKDEDSTATNSDRNLHIMSNCVINMPISLGLQKNSPIKPRVDMFIRRVIEGGFVKKWLNDVMQPTLTSEMNIDTVKKTSLMTLRKLYAGIIALITGYSIGLAILIFELGYWHFVVTKDPNFDKYTRTLLPSTNNRK